MDHTLTPNAAPGTRSSRARRAAWAVATLLLLAPLVAMRFTDEVVWTLGDFVFAAVLLYGPLALYEWAARTTGNVAYRAGVALALVGAFVVVWVGAAVGITDSDADGFYALALLAGIGWAAAVRFRPAGMARAMLAAALGVVLAGAVTLAAGMAAPTAPPFEVMGLTGFFATLFLASALLFREAEKGGRGSEAG